MASAAPAGTVSRPPTQSGRLTFSQLEQLWIQNGGNRSWAPTMAAVALAESGGNYGPSEINNNPSTGDYSVGLWQINYFGDLGPSRTQRYGPPSVLASDPNANARAAVDLLGANGSGITNWEGDRAAGAVIAQGGPLSTKQAQALGSGGGNVYAAAANITGTGLGQATADAAAGAGQYCGHVAGSNAAIPGNAFTIPHTSVGITYCQLKAMKGGLLTVAGGILLLASVALIIGKTSGLKGPAKTAAAFIAGRETAGIGGSGNQGAAFRGNRRVSKSELDYERARAEGQRNAEIAGPFEEG